jgi:hypothetical protein
VATGYLAITLLKIGLRKTIVARLAVKASRLIFKMFFVKTQMLALVELGNHDPTYGG